MSGVPPYTYLALGSDLTALGTTMLQYVEEGEGIILLNVEGVDLFEGGCLSPVRSSSQHPFNAYNFDYPYCRTALQFNMADSRADPQIGQLVVLLPLLSVKLVLVGCDQSGVISVITQLVPPGIGGCAAELYPGNVSNEFFLIIDKQKISLPARFNFTVNGTRKFWIGLRDSRDGRTSGSLI